MQSGLLLQILQLAPLLSTVDVVSGMLREEDLKGWAELAKKGTCMQLLQQIDHTIKIGRNAADEIDFERCTILLDQVFVSCSIHCPQLKHFNLQIEITQR